VVALPAVAILGLWFALQLLQGVLAPAAPGGVAFWAHIGGFVAGLVLIKLFARSNDVTAHRGQSWRPQGRIREGWRA
jgi:membrane associated rhomboid family serine protease